jgi:hypothetical protein
LPSASHWLALVSASSKRSVNGALGALVGISKSLKARRTGPCIELVRQVRGQFVCNFASDTLPRFKTDQTTIPHYGRWIGICDSASLPSYCIHDEHLRQRTERRVFHQLNKHIDIGYWLWGTLAVVTQANLGFLQIGGAGTAQFLHIVRFHLLPHFLTLTGLKLEDRDRLPWGELWGFGDLTSTYLSCH